MRPGQPAVSAPAHSIRSESLTIWTRFSGIAVFLFIVFELLQGGVCAPSAAWSRSRSQRRFSNPVGTRCAAFLNLPLWMSLAPASAPGTAANVTDPRERVPTAPRFERAIARADRVVEPAPKRKTSVPAAPPREKSGLEIMPAIAQVEALVAQWKIRDCLTPHGKRQPCPIMKGGIRDLVATQPAVRPGQRRVTHFSSPALHQSDCQCVRA